MRFLFAKRQNVFIKLIHDQAAATLTGMEALVSYLAEPNPAKAELLTKIELTAVDRMLLNEFIEDLI